MLPSITPQGNCVEARWLNVDLHVHSIYSGGNYTPTEILYFAKNQFCDGVAITDHNQTQGAIEGQQIAAQDPNAPQLIFGEEVSAGDHFHLVILGMHSRWGDLKRYELLKKVAEHRQFGGAVVLAHPWTMPQNAWSRDLLNELLVNKYIDGVELFNSALLEIPSFKIENIKKIWTELIQPFQLGVTGGSDFHYLRSERWIGKGRTYLKVFQSGERGILEALRSRRTVAGLFDFQTANLGWLGTGKSFLWGMEPWLSELTNLQNQLARFTQNNRIRDPFNCRLANNLITAGHFQAAKNFIAKNT